MSPAKAFAIVATNALHSVAKHEQCTTFTALAVVAEQMHLANEHRQAVDIVDAIQASDAKQMSFEALLGSRLAEGGK